MTDDSEVKSTDERTPNDGQSKPQVTSFDVGRDLDVAIELLEPGKPLVLNEGFLVTDSGNLIMSQYVDIGVDKLRNRPATLVKSIEAKYALEHYPDIQLSAPSRFQKHGETLIQDDQEGRAQRKEKTETPPRSFEHQNREQERALSLLGQKGRKINHTGSPNVHTDTETMTFGGSSWIYCTSIPHAQAGWSGRRTELGHGYDHESVIRQPGKFALALGEMFADQRGPQGKQGHFTHAGEIRSLHNSQFIMHGPVWYTDDVLGFLEARRSEPLYNMYPLFVKHSKYRVLREYRFVLHCQDAVEAETLQLHITGTMRDTLAPPRADGHVTFQRLEDPDADSASQKIEGPTPTHKTKTQTRRNSERQRRTLSIGGEVAQEEIIDSEQTVVLTTRWPPDGSDQDGSLSEERVAGEGELTEWESRERRIGGTTTDKLTRWRTRVISIADTSGADQFFSLEDRDRAAELLEAVGRPFEAFSTLPRQAVEALQSLAQQAGDVEPDVEVQTMSACWNSMWAICNLYECFGDVVASVSVEHNEFVAITLKQSAHTGAEGKILVGPRGTFSYLLTRGDEHLPGYGGDEYRLYFFPDEEARAAFEEFGWTAMEDESSSMEQPGGENPPTSQDPSNLSE